MLRLFPKQTYCIEIGIIRLYN